MGQNLSDIIREYAASGEEPPSQEMLLEWAAIIERLEEKAWRYDDLSR